jgi:hypothetical protein
LGEGKRIGRSVKVTVANSRSGWRNDQLERHSVLIWASSFSK